MLAYYLPCTCWKITEQIKWNPSSTTVTKKKNHMWTDWAAPSLSPFCIRCVSDTSTVCGIAHFLDVHVMSVGQRWKDIWSFAIWLYLVLPTGHHLYQTSTYRRTPTAQLRAACHRFLVDFELGPNFEQHCYPDSPKVSPELPVHAGWLPDAVFIPFTKFECI